MTTADLAFGLAQLVAARRTGLTWRSDGEYLQSEIGIFLGSLPSDHRDAAALMPYTLSQHPTLTSDLEGVQIRYRVRHQGDLYALRDSVRRALHGLFPVILPTGQYVAALTFSYGADLGRGPDRRWHWADSWAAHIGTTRTEGTAS